MWSPYVSVLDNPLSYVDPDGMKVVFATEDSDGNTIDWSNVINELEQLTGLTLKIGEGGVLEATRGGQLDGSETARNMLISAIAHGNQITIVNHLLKDSHVNMEGSTSDVRNTVNLNFDQIGDIVNGTSNDLNDLTYGYGMHFLHELGHTEAMGAMLDFGGGDYTAANVDNINTIRAEMSKATGTEFGKRVDYRPGVSLDDPGYQYEPFSQHANRRLDRLLTPKRGFIKHKPWTTLRAEIIKSREPKK